MPPPLQVYIIFSNKLTFDLLTLKVVSESRVNCEVGYLCANFSLSRPLCFRVRPDVRTDVRQKDRQTDKQMSDKSTV